MMQNIYFQTDREDGMTYLESRPNQIQANHHACRSRGFEADNQKQHACSNDLEKEPGTQISGLLQLWIYVWSSSAMSHA